jgi:hypothetical protein
MKGVNKVDLKVSEIMNLARAFHSWIFWVCRSWCNTHRTKCSLQTITEGTWQKYEFNCLYLVKCIKTKFLKSVNFGAEIWTKLVLVLPSHQQHSDDGDEGSPWNVHTTVRPSAREHFIEFCHRKSFRTYTSENYQNTDLIAVFKSELWNKAAISCLCCPTNINVDEVVTVNHCGWDSTTWPLIILNIAWVLEYDMQVGYSCLSSHHKGIKGEKRYNSTHS